MKKFALFILLFGFLISIHAFCANNTDLDRAITLYEWKYYDDAIIQLNALTNGMEPFASRAQFLRACCYLKKGNLKVAGDAFSAMAADPKFALYDYARMALGDIEMTNKQYEKAIGHFKLIFTDSALYSEAQIKMAECQYQLKDYVHAIDIDKALIAENSSLTPMDRVRLSLGKCLEKTGDPKGALQAYHELNLYDPLSPLMKEAISRINFLARTRKIYPEAASAEDLFNRATIFYNFGDFRSAAGIFQKIVTGYKSSGLWEESLFKLALCDYKTRRVSSAITRFKLCVAQGGDFADASQFYIAFAYGKSGYFYQALDALNKVVANYPNSKYAPEAAYYLGYYYEVNGFKDSALDCYAKFVDKYPHNEWADDAFWRMGRLYYFKGDYAKACDVFSRAVATCQSGDWLDACAYWKGLCQEKMGNKWDAISSYQYVINRFDHSYHSYRAREKLVALGVPDFQIKEDPVYLDLDTINEGPFASTPMNEEPLPFEPGVDEKTASLEGQINRTYDVKEHFRKYSELMGIGFYEEAANEAKVLVAASPADKKTSANLALATANLGAGQIKDSIIYAEVMCNNAVLCGTTDQLPRMAWNLAYPKAYYKYVSQYAAEFGIDEALVLAVIREESRFNPRTLSWANARGLMQIIPQTGYGVARLVGIRPYRSASLYQVDVNIRMGCYYLASLLKRFNYNIPYAVAAYNGGPIRVKKWINAWNAKVGPNIDMDEFVESIPLSETRRYVMKVMKSYYEYKRLYTSKYPRLIKG